MFAYLRGKFLDRDDNGVILDVNGVGYSLFCSAKTQEKLGQLGQEATVYVETHVREDHIHLYGFHDKEEKRWFRLLTSVQGVGAKVGLSILSALTPAEIYKSILTQDKAMISRADGVGPKLAARVTNELKDKVQQFAIGGISEADVQSFAPSTVTEGFFSSAYQDALSALVNLGYRRFDVEQILRQFAVESSADEKKDLQSLITRALQKLSSDKVRGGAA